MSPKKANEPKKTASPKRQPSTPKISEEMRVARKSLEEAAAIRIKFAKRDEHGGLEPYVSPTSYTPFFKKLGSEFEAKSIGLIDTKLEGKRDAVAFPVHLRRGGKQGVQLVAVSHETGLELLVLLVIGKSLVGSSTALIGAAVAAGITSGVVSGYLTNLASDATSGVIKYAWDWWRGKIVKKRDENTISIEVSIVEERSSDGRTKKVTKVEMRNVPDGTEAAKIYKDALKELSKK